MFTILPLFLVSLLFAENYADAFAGDGLVSLARQEIFRA